VFKDVPEQIEVLSHREENLNKNERENDENKIFFLKFRWHLISKTTTAFHASQTPNGMARVP